MLYFGNKDQIDQGSQVEKSTEELVADAIAQEFLSGEILDSDLSPFNICAMSVNVNGVFIRISWYQRPVRFRSINVSGGQFIHSDHCAEIILDAAVKRSKLMLSERLNVVSDKILGENYDIQQR